MKEYKVKIIEIENVTHDVKRFSLEKPANYKFEPGQATELSINKPGWENKTRPFSFTGLNDDSTLEFTIKIYPEHNGVTNELAKLEPGDELFLGEAWGAISYKGPGVFIAGGAGITPFIAILRQLHKENLLGSNQLIFSNKTSKDIILKEELETILGSSFINVITNETAPGVLSKRIDKEFLKNTITDFSQHFYVCGPEKFTEAMISSLNELGAKADSVVFEK